MVEGLLGELVTNLGLLLGKVRLSFTSLCFHVGPFYALPPDLSLLSDTL